MSSTDTGLLADRYAGALFELAEQHDALAALETDFAALTVMIAESADLDRLLKSPMIARKAQGAAIAALASKAEFHPLTQNFLGLLARNRRLFALTSVISAFRQRLARHRGEITAHVRTAASLSAAQKKSLAAALKKSVGQDVTLDIQIDPSLLGGLIAQIGSRMVDASLKTKLQQLTLALKGVR